LYTKGGESDIRKLHCSAASHFRGIQLLKSVEKTVSGLAKERNLKLQEKIEKEVENLNLKSEISDKIFDLVAKNLKMEESEEVGAAEFEDLGKSARLKSIEESFRKLDSSTVDENSIGLPSLANFEQKMLNFVDELR